MYPVPRRARMALSCALKWSRSRAVALKGRRALGIWPVIRPGRHERAVFVQNDPILDHGGGVQKIREPTLLRTILLQRQHRSASHKAARIGWADAWTHLPDFRSAGTVRTWRHSAANT